MRILKNHLGFIAFFSFTIAVFLYPLITMRGGFIWGDSFVQFYPWSKCYAESIKSFSFPYWIKAMGSGFPLMAEGQVGGFYPLNIVLFFALPFKIAYNYSVILHFIMGGIFTYLYSRKLGTDQSGGSLAALLFCFGSAYTGCFYNIVTLRTLAWFPLVLLFIENHFDKKELKYLFLGGVILGLQFLAGFVQMAAYSAFFYLAYFIYKAMIEKKGAVRITASLAGFFATAILIALPQLVLTYQLAGLSNREGATAAFALWGSVFPSGLLGTVFPYSFAFKGDLYVGILSLLFVVSCLYSLKKDRSARPLVLLLILSVFLALGRYNPVYFALIKITKLYIFRNPSKFLFFGSFSLAVLAGIGLTRYFNDDDTAARRKTNFVFLLVLSAAGCAFFAVKFLLALFKTNIISFGDYFVRNFIYNKPHHRYGLEYYIDKFKISYDAVLGGFSFSSIFVILSWAILIAALLFCLMPLRKRSKYIAVALIFVDIFIFSFYGKGFSQNIKPFLSLAPDNNGLLEYLKKDRDIYRILPFDSRPGKLPNWSIANANIAYGIDSVACYTPLVTKVYRDKFLALGAIDDSLGYADAADDAIKTGADTLRLLNVKYIIAQKELEDRGLEKVYTDNGVFLYRMRDFFPRLFFTASIVSDVRQSPLAAVKILTYKNGYIEAEVTAYDDGFVVFSENYYPGWHAFVDGIEKDMVRVKDILQAVAVGKGHHKVIFVYKPQFSLFKR
ncbi:MAG: YfhO family protein [Candidatus Omnitrophota bacterium]|nr:YfhO family protein [Candidatus Omnitrophota bacterium]